MKTFDKAAAAGEWRGHWRVVLAGAAGATLSSVHLYSTGVVIGSLEEQLGWSRAQISAGPSIVSVVGLALAPFIGMAIDRLGARRIGLFGALFFLAAFALLSMTTSVIWVWWSLWGLVAVAAAFISPTVWTAGVSSLFVHGRGLALAMTLCGTGIGALCVPIVANALLERYQWQGVYLGLTAAWAIIALPLLYWCFSSYQDKQRIARADDTSKQLDALPGLPVKQAMRSSCFFQLATAAALIALATTGVIVNMVPILRSEGMAPGDAAVVAGLIGIGSITGRLVGGYLLDRINANLVAGVSVTIPIASSLLLIAFPGSMPASAVAVSLLGLAVGIEFDAVAYLTARHFGMRSFGTLFGTITGVIVLVSGLGPLLVNVIYDLFDSYRLALYVVIPACALSATLFLMLGATTGNPHIRHPREGGDPSEPSAAGNDGSFIGQHTRSV